MCGHQPHLLRVPTEIARRAGSSTETAIRHVEQIIMTIMTKDHSAPSRFHLLDSKVARYARIARRIKVCSSTNNFEWRFQTYVTDATTCGSPQSCQVYKNCLILFRYSSTSQDTNSTQWLLEKFLRIPLTMRLPALQYPRPEMKISKGSFVSTELARLSRMVPPFHSAILIVREIPFEQTNRCRSHQRRSI